MSGSRASILRQIKNDVNFGEMKNSGTFAAVIGFTTRFIVCEWKGNRVQVSNSPAAVNSLIISWISVATDSSAVGKASGMRVSQKTCQLLITECEDRMVMVSDFEEDTFPCYSIHFRCGKPVVAKVVKELTDKTFPYHEKKNQSFLW